MTDGLVSALAKVQAKLPRVGKGKTADTGSYTYQYADLASIAEKIHPLLSENGLVFIAAPRLRGDRYLLVGALEHVSGEKRVGVFPLPDRGSPQQVGSALTYGRRYLLCSLTGVVADEDDDGQAASKAPAAQPKKAAPKKAGPRPVPDLREPLWSDIKQERERKGWSSADVQSDFAQWSDGKKLMDASADELQSYLETLKEVGDGAS